MTKPTKNKQLAELVKCRDSLNQAIDNTIRAIDAAELDQPINTLTEDACAAERAARDAAFTVRNAAIAAKNAAMAVAMAADAVATAAEDSYQAAETVLADCETQSH